jgi:regulator of protease activity HflC (stomatin/prohibitin superfamily)
MTSAVLTAVMVAWWGMVGFWAQVDPASDLIRSGYAQMGAFALLLGFGWWAIKQADKRTTAAVDACREAVARADARTAAAEKRAETAEADSRAVRDAFIKEVVPTMALQTARSEQLLSGLQQVVGVVEKVMTNALDRPK